MKIIKGLTGAIFTCQTCHKEWQDYLTAQKLASQHAKKTGHTVNGDLVYAVTYKGAKP